MWGCLHVSWVCCPAKAAFSCEGAAHTPWSQALQAGLFLALGATVGTGRNLLEGEEALPGVAAWRLGRRGSSRC